MYSITSMDGFTKACCAPSLSAPLALSGNQTPYPWKAGEGRDKVPGLVWKAIPGGEYQLGTEGPEAWEGDGEGPIRRVQLDAFRISAHTITNAQFYAFFNATGYRTDAERFGWSFVFHALLNPKKSHQLNLRKVPGLEWWYGVDGVDWRHPEGPGSSVKKRMNHPAVHVSWNDAAAFCHWAGLRLPTEAEWEAAARGGEVGKIYPWGDDLTPGGRHRCNIWQGEFPVKNSLEDGFLGTAPVQTYGPNGYGLYQVIGNVWEWVGDWFTPDNIAERQGYHPRGPAQGDRKTMKGGSYLCHHSYCNRYRCAARTSNTPDTSNGNCGFRVVG